MIKELKRLNFRDLILIDTDSPEDYDYEIYKKKIISIK